MLRLRRSEHESRIEIMPLIDVIFLLLTFFIYAMVLMELVRMVPMEPQEFASDERAGPAPAVTISIDRHGALFLDRQPIDLDDVLPRLREIVSEEPALEVYIVSDSEGEADRLPVFLDLYDRLANAGLRINLVGRERVDRALTPSVDDSASRQNGPEQATARRRGVHDRFMRLYVGRCSTRDSGSSDRPG